MTFEKIVEMLKDEYEKAKNLKHIEKPLAYSLYKVWGYVDKKERKRNVLA